MTWLSRVVRGSASSPLKALALRRYGSSAAALQYDYYSEEEDDWEANRRQCLAVADSAEGWVPGRGVQWVVIGDQGLSVRRHAYAEKLSNLLEVPLISMGSLLRQELSPRSPLHKQISNAVNEGKLVPEDVIFGLLAKRLDEGHANGESGFILDGIPRTKYQAEILDQVADIDLVVNLKLREENLVRNCCNMEKPGQYASGSSSWKENFHVYEEQGNELEEYYRKKKKLVAVEVASTAAGETWQGLLAALHLKPISVLKSTQNFVA